MHLANTIAIIQGKSLTFGQSDYPTTPRTPQDTQRQPRTPQDTQRQPRALRDSIICSFSMLYERVDHVMVLIYGINVMWSYLVACIFSILERSLLILTRITYRLNSVIGIIWMLLQTPLCGVFMVSQQCLVGPF